MEELTRICGCGTDIWEVPDARSLPRYTEQVICPKCGADHSRRPPLSARLKYGLYMLCKRRRIYGWKTMIRDGLLSAFKLPREMNDDGDPNNGS